MNQLASHIEILLLENDCVVIPGFGGFIAHNVSAIWNKEENLFIPPTRIIGFNPQLKMNDGLLVQSYMKTYKIDYNEANKLVQEETSTLISTLNNEGKIELPFIGVIKYSANESYHFSPYNEKLNSPTLYGLNSFGIQDLTSLSKKNNEPTKELTVSSPKRKHRINPMWKNVAAVAAAIILFFFMSTPIENTYIENQSYAHVFPGELLDKIKNESLITTQVVTSTDNKQNKKTEQTTPTKQVTPVAAKEVKVPQTETQKIETPKTDNTPKEEYNYHLIVSSVSNEADAERMVNNLRSKGYLGAKVIQSDGKIRVSIASYATYNDASKELKELRKIESYKNAWLLVK
ncbi:SPOR domain-containing protein [Bacteroides sp. 519]|uniref:HU domain-containing protein n=1 Tax=Bacteroides sp. 519 TaxID=2302937 RepID=UPI0013D6DD97|nr:SPOR domain-containing protein [Bacteroides sp. 519]NDV59733.1 SPOR domain-containing protein [Bacteroides sp. 519]